MDAVLCVDPPAWLGECPRVVRRRRSGNRLSTSSKPPCKTSALMKLQYSLWTARDQLFPDDQHGNIYTIKTIGYQPPGAANDSAFLMVQVMETWFLADRGTLRQFFGSALNENHFRQWLDLEAVPKDTVIDALERATANCQKPYSKGRVSFGLLGRIDPVRVANSCPHANYLLALPAKPIILPLTQLPERRLPRRPTPCPTLAPNTHPSSTDPG